MALLLRNIYTSTDEWFAENRDTRLADWPLVGSPWPTLTIISTYMYICLSLGPKLMQSRQPFQIGGIINAYNVMQIGWNAYVAGYILYATHSQPNFRFACYPINYSAQPTPMRIPVATYLYYIAKIVDLLDTVFFILRKKNGHVSFLHIYHHSMMVAAMYVAVNFMPGGHSWLLAMINSLVHVVMYAYYLFASVRPAAASLGDWKRLVTQIQMVQFVMLASHYAYGLAQSNCGDYPRPALLIGVIQNAFVFLMFADFYRRNYMKDDHNTSIVFAIQAQFHAFVHFVKNLFRPPNTNQ